MSRSYSNSSYNRNCNKDSCDFEYSDTHNGRKCKGIVDSDKKSYIDPNKLEGVGIIFIRREDPVSSFFMAVTKQRYSLIGFYYKSSLSGKEKINVVLADIYGIVGPKWFNSATIDEFIHHPLVTELSIKKIRPVLNKDGSINKKKTSALHCHFRATIAEVIKNGPEKSIREWIGQLFGYEIRCPTPGLTAIELVNKVIMKIGKWDQIPQSGHISRKDLKLLKPPEFLKKDAQGKNSLLQIIGSNFHQVEVNNPGIANKLLQSYLVDNRLFGDLYHVRLPKRSPIKVDLALSKSDVKNREFLRSTISTFVEMLMSDQKFFETVVNGINQSQMLNAEIGSENWSSWLQDELKINIINMLGSSGSIIFKFLESIKEGNLDREELTSLICQYRSDEEKLADFLDLNIDSIPDIECPSEESIIRFRSDTDSESNYETNLSSLREKINNIVESLTCHETPTINLNDLIGDVNNLIECSKSKVNLIPEVTGEISCSAIISVSDESCRCLPLRLESGKKILLPTTNYDLSIFTQDELYEILEALDVIVDNDGKFDAIRSQITSRLA